LLFASASILAGCERGEAHITEQQERAVVASVDSATRAFEAAQRALDAERVVAHLAPEFYMHADGQRIGYDSVVTNIRRDFSQARHVEPGFQAIDVLVLSPRTALASFRYRDSVVAADGALRRFRGATTLAWTRRGTGWLIVYAHADHEEDRVP
jgi:ketosteroid isomerase-like protein